MGSIKECPECHIQNPVAANYCRHCGYQFSKESKHGEEIIPVIKELLIMDGFYTKGSLITIMWEAKNYTTLSLDGVDVSNQDSYKYEVKDEETLELKAATEFMEVKKSIKISPRPLPKILKFNPSRKYVREGETVNVTIECKGADRITLQSNMSPNMEVKTRKSVPITPKKNERFTLVCYSKDPSVSIKKNLDLHVIEKIVIKSFTSDRDRIMESLPVTLHWEIDNAQKITLYPGELDVTGKTRVTVHPKMTTLYRIEGRNELGSETEVLSVYVNPLPKFHYEIPDLSKITLPEFSLDMDKKLDNLREISLDRWMNSPLNSNECKTSFIKRIINYLAKQWIKN